MKRSTLATGSGMILRLVTAGLFLGTLLTGVRPAVADTAFPTDTWPSTGTNPVATAINVLTGKVYIANKGSDSVTVYDPMTGTTSTVALATGSAPSALAVDPDSNIVYVADSGTNKVAVIDAGNGNAVSYVTVGTNPVAVAVNAAIHRVYVVNKGSNNLTVIDAANGNAATPVTVGSTPVAVAVDPTAGRAYVVNQADGVSAGSLTIIDSSNKAANPVPVGVNPQAVAVNPTTGKVYVANKAAGTVTVVDTGAGNAITTVTVGSNPVAVAVNPVSNMAYVVNQGDGVAYGTVTAINGSGTPATVTVGVNPQAVAVSVLTNRLYVTNGTDGTVTVIDAANGNATSSVAAGTTPKALVYDPIRNRVYVANAGSNNLAVVDGAAFTTTDKPAGTDPQTVAVNPVTHKVYFGGEHDYSSTEVDPVHNTVHTDLLQSTIERIAVNPVTNAVYLAGMNGIAMIDAHGIVLPDPECASPGMSGTVWDVAVNPVTNKVYGACNTANGGYLEVRDDAKQTYKMVPAGSNPQGVAVNPVTNRVYLTDYNDHKVRVYDGATDTLLTTIVSDPSSALWRVAVNPTSNKVYVLDDNHTTVTVIDGATNTVVDHVPLNGYFSDISVDPVHNQVYLSGDGLGLVQLANDDTPRTVTGAPSSCDGLYADPVTGRVYANCTPTPGDPRINVADMATMHQVGTTSVTDFSSQVAFDPMLGNTYFPENAFQSAGIVSEKNMQTLPLTVTVTPLAGNTATGYVPAIDYQVSSPPNKVYYQVDTWTGTWQQSTPTGSTGTVALPGLSRGVHTLYLFAGDGQEAGAGNSGGGTPVLGAMTAYLFLVNPPAPDGAGAVAISQSTVVAGQSTTLGFTYTAPSAGYLTGGSVQVAPPARWGAPASCTGASVVGGNILASSLNLSSAQTATFSCTWTTSPSAGTDAFTVSEASTAGGTLTPTASPTLSVSVAAGTASPTIITSANPWALVTLAFGPTGSLSGTPTITVNGPRIDPYPVSATQSGSVWSITYQLTYGNIDGTYTATFNGTTAEGAAISASTTFKLDIPAHLTITPNPAIVTAAGYMYFTVSADRETPYIDLTITLPDNSTQTMPVVASDPFPYIVAATAPNGTYGLSASGTAYGGTPGASTGTGSFRVAIPAVFTVTTNPATVTAAGSVGITVSSDRPLTGTPALTLTRPDNSTQTIPLASAGGNTYTGAFDATTAANGTYHLSVTGTAVGAAASTGSGSFTVAIPANLTVTPNPATVTAAGSVGITVSSDRPLSGPPTLTVTRPDNSTQAITLTAGSGNSWTGSYSVAAGDATGTYNLSVTGTATGAAASSGSGSFTVAMPAVFTFTTNPAIVTAAGSVGIAVSSDRQLTGTPTLAMTLPDNSTQTITLMALSGNTWIGSYSVAASAPNGTYSLSVTGTATGAAASTGSGSFTVAMPAVFTVTPNPATVTAAGSVGITISSDRPLLVPPALTLTLPDNSTQTITLASAGGNTYTGSFDASTATNGIYSLSATGTAAGAAASAGSGTFTVAIPAVLTVTPSPATVTVAGSVGITVSSDRPLTGTPALTLTLPDNSTQTVALASAGGSTYTGSFDASLAANGTYSLSVTGTATGAAASTGSGSFTVAIPAVLTVTPNPATVTSAGSVGITVRSDRPLSATPALSLTRPDNSTQTITLASAGGSTYTGSFDASTAANGTYNLSVTGTATGAAASTGSGSFTVAMPAVFTVTPNPATITAAGSVGITVSSDRPLTAMPGLTLTLPDNSTQAITLTAGSGNSWTGSYSVAAGDANGTYTLSVTGTATGAAASTGSGSFAVAIPAVLTVTPNPAIVTAAGTVGITVSSDRPLSATPTLALTLPDNSTQAITLTADSGNTWTGSYSVAASAPNGTYTLGVTGTATGAAASTGSGSFTVAVPAVLTVTPNPPRVTVGGSVTLTVGSDRPLTAAPTLTLTLPDTSTTAVALTAGAGNTWTGTYRPTAPGSYSADVSAIGTGSATGSTASATFQVINPPPPSSGGGSSDSNPPPQSTTTTTVDGQTTVTVTEQGDSTLTTITSDTNLKVSVGGVASVDLPAGSVTASSEGASQGAGDGSAPPAIVQVKLTVLPVSALPGTSGTGEANGQPATLPADMQVQTAIEVDAHLTVTGSTGQAVHQLANPVTIAFKVDPAVLAQDAQAVVAYYNPDLKIWVQLPTTIDPVTGTVTTTVSHFTTFAVFTSRQATSRLATLPAGTTKDALIRAAGTALKGTTITLYDNGKPVSAVSMPDDGSWSLGASLEEGVHRLMVVAAEKGDSIGLGESVIMYEAPPASAGFSDLAGYDWAKAAITDLADRQIMQGYSDGSFQPGANATRATFVDALVKALHLKGSSTLSFTDVAAIPAGMRESVAIAVANGILTGFPDGSLRPNDPLTRAQAAALLDRALKLAPVAVQTSPVRLKDAGEVPSWAASAIDDVVTHGLMKGYDDGAFHADDNLTRAQVAVLVERYLQMQASP